MTATAEITVQQLRDVLLVPNAALRFVPPAGESEPESGSILRKLFPHRPQRVRTPNAGSRGERQLWLLHDDMPVAVAAT